MSTHNIPNPSAAERAKAVSAPTRYIKDILDRWRPQYAGPEESLISTFARFARRLVSADGESYEVAELLPQPGTPVLAAYATGTLTGDTIAADDTVTIDDITYTFVSALSEGPTVPNEILVGATDSDSLDNLIAAINGAAGEGTTYSTDTESIADATAAAGAGDTMTLTADAIGPSGNSIATTASLTGGDWGEATLEGGQHATTARAGSRLYDSSYLYLAIADVSEESTTGWKKTSLANL